MRLLVFNCGSSSLKYRLIEMPDERERVVGEAQRVGPRTAEPSRIIHRRDGRESTLTVDMPDHGTAFRAVMRLLVDTDEENLQPDALAHRFVHGGDQFATATVIDEPTFLALEKLQPLAPIHNPPALALIRACRECRPALPQVAVFDTAFHATISPGAYTYALPIELREQGGFRKYGFHGTSHQYVVREAAAWLGKPVQEFSGVSCHLGSGGASLCAVVDGRSVDNTMGYSPLQGLMMSTRCGDTDPAVVLRLLVNNQGDVKTTERMLNRDSGVLGLSGISADIRDVLAAANGSPPSAQSLLTKATYCWRIRKYLGAYLTLVGRADAVIFTDTIGETVSEVRQEICTGLECFGLRIDPNLNAGVRDLPVDVAASDSLVRALVIRTNEELAIARLCYRTLCERVGPGLNGKKLS